MSNPGYGLEISKMLFKAEPKLLACDAGAVARASGSLANVMGAVLASVLEKQGEATYRELLKHLLLKIDESARSTQEMAHRIAANDMPAKNN